MFSCDRRAMALVCWMVLISIPLISSAAIGQALTKKDASTMAVNFQSNTVYKKKTTSSIRCFCNLPECGEQMNCTTHKGCFSELQPILPDVDYVDASSTTAETTGEHSNDGETTSVVDNHTMNDTYGCLDMLSVVKTCDQILKSMEGEDSEIPILKHATAQNDVVRAYHCCQEDMCNDHGRVASFARTVQEALATVIRNSMSQLKEEQPAIVAATFSEPSSPSHPDAAANAINGAKTAQTEKPDDSSSTTAASPSSVAPSATDLSTTGSVTTTTDLVGDENATPVPVTASSVDYNLKEIFGDVTVVSHDSTVAASTSTDHVPSTSTVSTDSSTVHSTTEVPVAVTTVDSSGNVTEATQSTTASTTTTTITTVGSSGNVTEATQSTTTIATTTAAAAAAVDGFTTGNDLTKNLASETTAPVVIAETSTIEIATTTKGSAEQESPIVDASNAVHVVLTHDKVYAKLNETSPIDSAVAPQHNGVKFENAPHVFAVKDEVTTDNDSVNQDHSRVESSALINQISGPLPVGARNNWSFLYVFLDFSGIYAFATVGIAVVLVVTMVKILKKANIFKKNKGVCITPGELCACEKTSVETATPAPKCTGTCTGCVGASKYAYTAIPELPFGPVRH